MGSRLSLHTSSSSNVTNVRTLRVTSTSGSSPVPVGGASTGNVNRSNDTPSSPTAVSPTRKKYAKGVGHHHHDNSLQIQLCNNHIFQRQQQRLHSQTADDPNEVLDSLPAIRVPLESNAFAGSQVLTSTLPRRSPSSQNIMNFKSIEPQQLNRSGTLTRIPQKSSESSPSEVRKLHRSTSKLGRSYSRQSLNGIQNHFEVLSDRLKQIEMSNANKGLLDEKIASNNNLSVENRRSKIPTNWQSSIVSANLPLEMLSSVQDEYGFQRGIRTPDFVYMRVHPSCARKYIVPVEKSGKTRLIEMKHILKQETVAGEYGVFQNCHSMDYAFVRVQPPLDESFVVTSGDACREIAVFTGKSWEVVHTGRRCQD